MKAAAAHLKVRHRLVIQAAMDFFYLQNHKYPRSSALDWVGNRYALHAPERQLLSRGVYSQAKALERRAKKGRGVDWSLARLAVDGHNVQITVESAILGKMLLKSNDGAIRDLAGLSAKYSVTWISETAMNLIFDLLRILRPAEILFLFDSPMSHSGELAAAYRKRLTEIEVTGDARAVPVPEREIPYSESVVASSDGEVLDRSCRWIDLASMALERARRLNTVLDFSSFIMMRSVLENHVP
jgi:hypothetical protein